MYEKFLIDIFQYRMSSSRLFEDPWDCVSVSRDLVARHSRLDRTDVGSVRSHFQSKRSINAVFTTTSKIGNHLISDNASSTDTIIFAVNDQLPLQKINFGNRDVVILHKENIADGVIAKIKTSCKPTKETLSRSMEGEVEQLCPMEHPLKLCFYIDTSINNRQYNLDHYSAIISDVLNNFAFMHRQFNGQNRVAIYGYGSLVGRVKIFTIWESVDEDIGSSSAFNTMLVRIADAIKNPRNIHNVPAAYDDAFMAIHKHIEGTVSKDGKAIILTDTSNIVLRKQ